MFTISKSEWKTARHYLRKEKDGTKLTYSAQLNEKGEQESRKNSNKNKDKWFKKIERDKVKHPKIGQTFHSFIKLAGVIYGIAQGKESNALIGAGQFGKVKYMMNSNGALFVVKIQNSEEELQYFEVSILQDRQLSTGRFKIIHFTNAQDQSAYNVFVSKYAMPMNYLGNTLKNTLLAPCSDELRLTIAIALCLEVHDLHKIRTQSLSKTAYAHRDIKPDNATWDEKTGRVHLIDFGFAHDCPLALRDNDRGTAAYLPKKSSNNISGEQFDNLALRRTLFLQNEGYCSQGYFKNYLKTDPNLCPGLLTSTLLKQLGLKDYIDTSSTKSEKNDFAKHGLSAGTLAALLIAAKLRLNIEFETIVKDQYKTLVICGLFNRSKEHIEEILNDKRQTLITAAFSEMGLIPQLTCYRQDPIFFSHMMQLESHEQCCVLIHLKSVGLDEFYQATQSPELTHALYVLIQQPINLSNRTNTLSVLEQPYLARGIGVLVRIGLQEHFKKLFSSKLLCETIAMIDNQDIKALHHLVSLFELGLSSNAIVLRFMAYEREEDCFVPFQLTHKKSSKNSNGFFSTHQSPKIVIENEALEYGDYGMYTF